MIQYGNPSHDKVAGKQLQAFDDWQLHLLQAGEYSESAWTRFFDAYWEVADGGWYKREREDRDAWAAIDAALVVAQAGIEPATFSL